MKIKKIMLVTFVLLAILTIGAVSASDDVASDDNLTVSDDGVDESPISEATSDEEVLTDSPYEENGFDPIVAPMMELDDDEAVVDINTPDEGNFTIYVTDSDDKTSEFNHEIDEDDVKEGYITWNLKDLNITEAGIYKLSAKYINDTGFTWVFEDYRLIVTEDSMITFADEYFDINDDEEPIVSIYCPEGLTGVFLVKIFEEDDEDWKDYDEASHIITDEDYGEDINFTLSSFDKKINVGLYEFRVYLLNSETDEPDDDNKIDSEELSAVDSTKFWAEIYREVSLTNIESVVYVFCPDESTGTVTVTVRKGDEDEGTSYSKDVSQREENWLEWTLRELGITCDGEYFITVEANNTIVERGVRLGVGNPIYFNEEVSYLESDNPDRAFLVEFEISSEITGGRIIITSNGAEIFNKALSEFSDEESVDAPYWYNPRHGGDESIKVYRISNSNTNPVFGEGTYELTVIADVDGLGRFNNTGEVRISKVNSKKDDDSGVEIAIYDAEEYTLDDDWSSIIEVFADSNEGEINVTVEGTEFSKVIPLNKFDDGSYSLSPEDFEELGVGIYNITVAYWKDGEQVFNHTGTITFGYGEDGIMSSDVDNSIDFYDDWGINVWFATNDISGNLVIKLDGVEYYNKHVNSSDFNPDEFDDEGQGHFPFSAYGLKIPVGKYKELTISYFGDDDINDTDVWENIEVTNEPRINLCYSDWDEKTAEFCIWEDNYIHIYPNGDDSDLADIIIIVKIGDEIYVNSTLAELNLDPKYEENGVKFYQFGPTKITDITFGRYDDVVAYYISPKYQKDTTEDEDAPDFINVVGIVDEVDYADTESTVISVLCNRNEGKIIIHFRNIEKEDIEYDIEEEDKGKFIDFNLTYLNIAEIGDYDIEVGYDDGEYLFDNWLSVTNNTDFRVKSDCEWLNTNEEVFFIFCPQDGQGLIKLSGNNINTIEYTITDKDKGNYIGFTLSQLGITSPDTYDINVEVNGKAVGEGIYELDVPSQVEFNMNSVVVLSDSDENINLMRVASLRLPSDAAGNVTITVDGTLVFNQDVSEFGYLDWDGLFCDIYSSQLSPKVQAGEHKVTVAFGGMTTTKTLSFVERNMKSEGDVSIEMFNTTVNIDNNEDYFAIVSVLNDDGSGRISIFVDGTEYRVENIWDDDLRDENDWDNVIGKIYYINLETNDTLRNNAQPGEMNVTVVYYDGGDNEVIRNNATITLYRAPWISICYSDWQAEEAKFYIFGEDEGLSLIDVYPNVDNSDLSDIIITLKIGNEILFNDSLSKLNYTREDNNGDTVYHVMFSNFNKALDLGRQRVVAYYQSPNYKTDSYGWDGDLHLIDVYLNKNSKVDPSFNVEPIADAIQGSDVVIVITANEYFTGTVDVKIGNINKTADITKGKGKLTVNSDDLAVGSVVVNVTSKEDDNFIAGQKDVKFNVLPKIDPALTIAVANVVEGNPAVVTITTNASFSGNVKVKIGTTEYVVPVSNGKGSLTIPNLATNTYTAVATFDSVGIFAGAEKTTTFTVTKKATTPVKKATKIIAKKKTFKANKKVKKYTITLKSGKKLIKGAKVTLKVGKKTYKAKTNKKGKATFKITKLNKKGKYKAVIKFAGTKLYKASKKTVKITVKK